MGQKISPISLRIGGVKPWVSRWFFPGKGKTTRFGRYPYAKLLQEDEAIRKIIRKKISLAGIAGLEIERTSNRLKILIRAARPGLVIGQGGKGIEELTRAIEAQLRKLRGVTSGKNDVSLSLNVEELKRSEVSAAYIAQQIAWELERRLPFRRVIKKQIEFTTQNKEVKGVKIQVSGRLDGSEIARREVLKRGPMPLQTLRTDIDYGTATAWMTYGTIGIKIWIYKGEVFEERSKKKE